MMAEKPQKRYPGEKKGFVEEMRFVAMKLHTRDQAKEGEKEPDTQPVAKWEPSIEGYLRFLVDSKVVYDTLESIVDKAAYPTYAEFRNTGLERSDKLAEDLQWFKKQGHAIPEPSTPGTSYARYLEELSEKDPPAFICHFYNVYFAHTAGGRMIGKKVPIKWTWNGHHSMSSSRCEDNHDNMFESNSPDAVYRQDKMDNFEYGISTANNTYLLFMESGCIFSICMARLGYKDVFM